MIQAHNNDFEAFFTYVAKLGDLQKPMRDSCLELWDRQAVPEAEICPGSELAE